MEVSVKEARKNIKYLLDRVNKGEEVIITRRGKAEAKLIPIEDKEAGNKELPDLNKFRALIKVKGKPLSQIVIEERNKR